jgi:hypothetical protein
VIERVEGRDTKNKWMVRRRGEYRKERKKKRKSAEERDKEKKRDQKI